MRQLQSPATNNNVWKISDPSQLPDQLNMAQMATMHFTRSQVPIRVYPGKMTPDSMPNFASFNFADIEKSNKNYMSTNQLYIFSNFVSMHQYFLEVPYKAGFSRHPAKTQILMIYFCHDLNSKQSQEANLGFIVS